MKRFQHVLVAWCLVALAFVAWSIPVRAQSPAPEHPVTIYLFWGEGCPHCAKAKPYYESLEAKYPGLTLKTFEVYYDEDNQQLFVLMAQKFGLEQLGVPTMFIGPHYLQGYSEEMNEAIEQAVVHCLENGCADAAEGIPGLAPTAAPTATTAPESTATPENTVTPVPDGLVATSDPPAQQGSLDSSHSVEIPLIGSLNLNLQSAALSTMLIAVVDGFNPCSIWVLSMLLALTLHTGSRKKVLIIGLIFLTVTAAIYALFIAGLFSVLKVASFLGWIRVVVALVALFFALVNIKDYFWYKQGLSFTIAEHKRAGIFRRIRVVMDASQTFWGLAGATVVLAAGVSMVEFSCTAGFPVLWVNLLTAQNVGIASFVLLLLLYMFIYQLDELVIFFSAVASLKASRLEEKHGRLLKLAGGMLMLALSVVMLANPALMNRLNSSLLIFGMAALATLLVLFVHRVILPRFGIRIGTEFGK